MAQETVTKFFVEHIQRWLDDEIIELVKQNMNKLKIA